jgi:hypothetical protein
MLPEPLDVTYGDSGVPRHISWWKKELSIQEMQVDKSLRIEAE